MTDVDRTWLPRRIIYLSLEARERFYQPQQASQQERKRARLGDKRYYENKKPRPPVYPLFVRWSSQVHDVHEGEAMLKLGFKIPPEKPTLVHEVLW